jgi:hypothetical protein
MEGTPEELTTNTGEYVVKYKLLFKFWTRTLARILRCLLKYSSGGQKPIYTATLAQNSLSGNEKKTNLEEDASQEIKEVISVVFQTDIFAEMFVSMGKDFESRKTCGASRNTRKPKATSSEYCAYSTKDDSRNTKFEVVPKFR